MKLIVLLSVLFSSQIYSAEVDQFTNRHEKLSDVSEIVNTLANTHVRDALKKLKNQNAGCDEEKLYEELREIFANHSNGSLTITILENPQIEKRVTTFKNSVFREWTIFDGLVMSSPIFKNSGLTISPLVRMGDQVVGTDKFEHMFGRGFQYFTNYYLKKKDFPTTVKRGIRDEKIIFGGSKFTNGVFSYSDLSANFNGMRFWNHMLQLREDVIGQNIGPYISCQNNAFVQNKEIDFRNYFDESMDEGINCSKFPSERTLKKFKNQVQKLGMTCPMDKDLNQKMVQKYGTFARWIINQKGNGVVNYTGEFEE